jgi:hypothetical protein
VLPARAEARNLRTTNTRSPLSSRPHPSWWQMLSGAAELIYGNLARRREALQDHRPGPAAFWPMEVSLEHRQVRVGRARHT